MPLTQVQGGMILPSTTLTTPIVATTMGVGGATPSNSGSGITFPAAQSASSDANTLDDYEEGTWTPNVGGNATYNAQSGSYIKIGRLVWATFDMTVNVIGTGSSSVISGLPFTSGGSTNGMTGSVSYWASSANGAAWVGIRNDTGETTIKVSASTATNTTTATAAFGLFGNGTRLIGSIIYQTD